jgi:dienelactone hydrolase
MIESPVVFGADENLVGILTEPAEPLAEAPLVILLNAGVVHRVGPHRLHVIVARRLASMGLSSFRIDLSGIGDSRALDGSESFRERAVADVRAAIELFEAKLGAKKFVLFGLCAGADNAIATALVEPRVAGLILVDPYTYATSRSRRRKILGRMREHAGVRSALRWGASIALRTARDRLGDSVRHGLAVLRASQGGVETGAAEPGTQNGRVPAPVPVFGEQLGRLSARGVAMLAVYSGIHDERYNAEGQMFETFPELRGRVDERFFPEANHTFTELAQQAAFLETVTEWLTARHGARRERAHRAGVAVVGAS